MIFNFNIKKPAYYNVGLYAVFLNDEINSFQISGNIKKFKNEKTKKKISQMKKFCDNYNLKIIKCYFDIVKSYDSNLLNRRSLNNIIKDLEDGKINCIITDKLSNFFEGTSRTKFDKIFYYCFNETNNPFDKCTNCYSKRFIAFKDNVDSEKCKNKFIIKFIKHKNEKKEK
eukprot:jgi/Orpsp1_1/1187245/evm.model.d7180000056316.1